MGHSNFWSVFLFLLYEKNPMCYGGSVMRFIKPVSFLFSLVMLPVYRANAATISSNVFNDINLTEDTLVLENAVVRSDNLYVDATMTLENHGLIQTNIIVDYGRELRLKNTGTINADFVLESGATLIHEVTNAQELQYIDFDNTKHIMNVESSDVLSLSGILNVGQGASKINIQNTRINIDAKPAKTDTYVQINGNVVFVLGNSDGIYEDVFLDDVRGGAMVRFESLNINPLFADYGYIKNNKLYVGRMRETDYAKVFDNDLGRFLNSARESGKNDSLFSALDTAMDMGELNHIMNSSVLFNRDILFQPLRIVNALDSADVDLEKGDATGGLFGIKSDNFYMYGLNVGLYSAVSEKLRIHAGVRVGTMDYLSDFDVFGGNMYTLNLGAKYLINTDSFVRLDSIFNFMHTDINSVFYDGAEIDKPRATSGYINTDVGHNFVLDNGFVLSPFIGIVGERYSVDNYSDSDIGMRAGTDVKFETEFSGIKYIYATRVIIDINSYFAAAGSIGVWSDMDALGADVSATVTNSQNVISYKLSIDGKISF